jgi:hypothetical protein
MTSATALPRSRAIAERKKPSCSQLIYMYQGNHDRMMMAPATFIARARIIDRNLVMYRDPKKNKYHGEICDVFPNIESTINWQRELRHNEYSHATSFYCTGTSMGAYAALLFGHYLQPEIVHAFAPPTHFEGEDTPDMPAQHADLRLLLSDWNGVTQYHVYYCRDFARDVEHSGRLEGLPGVTLHPMPGDTHSVFRSPEGERLLDELFPPFSAVES